MDHFPCEHSFFVCEIDFEGYLLFTCHEVGKCICYPLPLPNQSVNYYVWWLSEHPIICCDITSNINMEDPCWQALWLPPRLSHSCYTHLATIDTRHQWCTEHNYNFNNDLWLQKLQIIQFNCSWVECSFGHNRREIVSKSAELNL
jgi:hypothetical protein